MTIETLTISNTLWQHIERTDLQMDDLERLQHCALGFWLMNDFAEFWRFRRKSKVKPSGIALGLLDAGKYKQSPYWRATQKFNLMHSDDFDENIGIKYSYIYGQEKQDIWNQMAQMRSWLSIRPDLSAVFFVPPNLLSRHKKLNILPGYTYYEMKWLQKYEGIPTHFVFGMYDWKRLDGAWKWHYR